VFITGAARGIGAEAARQLAAKGARVALVGLEPGELAKVAGECGPEAVWFECDVTDRESLQAAIDGTVERLGGIDVCIANAGIAGGGLIRLSQPEAIERILEVNLIGAARTLRLCLPHVIERRGYLLAIASLAATTHSPGMAAYSASKAGIEAFGDSLRTELKHHGVGVGVGYFSWIDTEMVRGADARRGYRFLRAQLRGPLGKTYPVSDAGAAIVQGIETKARWVMAPRWSSLLIMLRSFTQLISERLAARQMPEFERIAEDELAEIGLEKASEPVGAGGHAAAEAARRRTGGTPAVTP
jgi:NAD(P)-dependent dehydrogenase (short-subunit alcohol dehydrogenase family)